VAQVLKLFGYQDYIKTDEPLRRDCFALAVKSDSGNGVSFFLPWMTHGEYYEQCSNIMRFGWRCLRVNIIFNLKLVGPDGELSGRTKRIKFIFYMEPI
jgi:hypothetical protein